MAVMKTSTPEDRLFLKVSADLNCLPFSVSSPLPLCHFRRIDLPTSPESQCEPWKVFPPPFEDSPLCVGDAWKLLEPGWLCTQSDFPDSGASNVGLCALSAYHLPMPTGLRVAQM